MKTIKMLCILLIALVNNPAAAYEGEEKPVCKKPKFYKFDPYQKKGVVEVPPGSEFSFHASNYTKPESIEVAVKKIKTPVEVENRNSFLIIRGRLPESLSNTFARISIKGTAQLGCKRIGAGWLVKITGPETVGEQQQNPDTAKPGAEEDGAKEPASESKSPKASATTGD